MVNANAPVTNISAPDLVLVVLFFFLAFIIGVALQGLSAWVEDVVNRRRYGGYPSILYLEDGDPTFPKYFKDRIRQLASEAFGTPTGSAPQHIFDLCYSYVVQRHVSDRVLSFLHTYTFARNMMVTTTIAGAILLVLAFHRGQMILALLGLISFGLSYLFYRRFLRYAQSFAKEVLRSFFIDRTLRAL